jgi:hypothetical protein
MAFWDDHRKGISAMLFSLDYLQKHKEGFISRSTGRKNVSPAHITQLKNGVDVYSEFYPEFLEFMATVSEDYSSPYTSPATFENPVYFELRVVLEKKLLEL